MICNSCKKEKQNADFYNYAKDRRCKDCCRERTRKAYSPEKAREKYVEFRRLNPKKNKTRPAIDRLMDKIEIIPESGCWIFMGSLNRGGYGMIGDDAGANKLVSAHRKIYSVFKGEIPAGMCVCHSCDVPSCCNPSHLFLGTQIENIKDCVNKNRQAAAEKNGKSKLSEEQVRQIIDCKKSGGNLKKLSKELPVSYWQVCAIASGRRRKSLNGASA